MDRSYLELLSKRIWEMAPLHWTAVPGILYIETTLLNSRFIIWLTTAINWVLTDFWVKSPVNNLGLCTPFKNALHLCHATITMQRNSKLYSPLADPRGASGTSPSPPQFLSIACSFWGNFGQIDLCHFLDLRPHCLENTRPATPIDQNMKACFKGGCCNVDNIW